MQTQQVKDKMNGSTQALKSEASHIFRDLTDSALDLKDRVTAASSDAVEQSVEFVKKYPVYTALGAAAIGFIAGALIRRNKN